MLSHMSIGRAGIGPEGKKKMSQWVTKTIKELLGEEEQTLVRGWNSFRHAGRRPNPGQPEFCRCDLVASAGVSVPLPDRTVAVDRA